MSNGNRSTSRRSRIEDIEMLIALRNAIYDCQIAINQSLAVIDATVEAIKLFDRLQQPARPTPAMSIKLGRHPPQVERSRRNSPRPAGAKMAELAGAAIGPKAAIDPPGRVSVQPVSTE